jgi:two-component system, NarL family, nitrate/nitrite response regulator NarL
LISWHFNWYNTCNLVLLPSPRCVELSKLATCTCFCVGLEFATPLPNIGGGSSLQTAQPLCRKIRVFIADSSSINSQLLAETLARHERVDVVGFGSSPEHLLNSVITSRPDIVLLSARLEEQSTLGLDILRQLRSEGDKLKAIVLLDSSTPDLVTEAFRSGASGVFCRSARLDTLPKCITAVHEGQIWANSKELSFVLKALTAQRPFQPNNGNGLALLSKREREVVCCLAEALTNRQIAERLNISQHTVKNYMFKIFDKLGVSTRVELIFYVLSRRGDNGNLEAALDQANAGALLRQ